MQTLITRERMRSYLDATGQELPAAFELYRWNSRISSALLEPIAIVEVVVRNRIDHFLTRQSRRRYGTDRWFDVINLNQRGQADVATAIGRAGRSTPDGEVVAHGRVVAELGFGFWRFLLSRYYYAELWVPSLRYAFPGVSSDLPLGRAATYSLANDINFVRNRIAHHEPIHRRDLGRDYDKCLQLLGLVDEVAVQWVRSSTRHIPELIASRP